MSDSEALDLRSRSLDQVEAILRDRVPDYGVWAFGSRVSGGVREASDLDLVVRHEQDLSRTCPSLFELRQTFTESDLPIRVDVMDWARIPDAFRKTIAQRYVVLDFGVAADMQAGSLSLTRWHLATE